MKRRFNHWVWGGLVIFVLIITIVIFGDWNGAQPIYAGKPILYYFPTWVSQKQFQNGPTITFAPNSPIPPQVWAQIQGSFLYSTRNAKLPAAITAEGIPWLLRVIRREDTFIARLYEKHQAKVPSFIRQRLPVVVLAEANRSQAQQMLSTVLNRDLETSVPYLTNALATGSFRERIAVAQALWTPRFPKAILAALALNLNHENEQVRQSALSSLLRPTQLDPETIAAIVKFWENPRLRSPGDWRHAEQFCQNMSRQGAPAQVALPALAILRTNENSLVSVEASFASWQINPSDLQPQRELLGWMSPDLNHSKYRPLTAKYRALGFLAQGQFASQGRAPLRVPAAEVLTSMKQVAQESDPSALSDVFFVVAQLKAEALPMLPEVLTALRNTDRRPRAAAISAIDAMGPAATEAIPALILALEDPATQLAAAKSLANFGSKAAAAATKLVERLDDRSAVAGNTDLRAAAARSLGNLGITNDLVLSALKNAARSDETTTVRDAARAALVQLQQGP